MSKKKAATEETEAVQVEEEVQVPIFSFLFFFTFSTFLQRKAFALVSLLITQFNDSIFTLSFSFPTFYRSFHIVLFYFSLYHNFSFLTFISPCFLPQEEKYGTVEKILGRTGSRGAVTQVRLAFVHDPTRKIIRNVIV